jgi:hypothetical protein
MQNERLWEMYEKCLVERLYAIPSASQCRVPPGPQTPQDTRYIQSKICPLHGA